jgi:protein O-mannosyl-transferase
MTRRKPVPVRSPTAPKGVGDTPPKGGRGRDALICIALFAVTLAIYFQTAGFDFINVDDPAYVPENPYVLAGLTLPSVKWSWTHFHDSNWIPLTWMSLMCDTSFYGYHPGGYHLTNAVLHAANSIVLYLALAAATGAWTRSAVVAALFALHPLHVESVAWVAERKDVLSTFFGFLSLLYYVRYATRGHAWRLAVSLVCFVCSLLSKQTFVTLPFVLLLLDYWPLGRLSLGKEAAPPAPVARGRGAGSKAATAIEAATPQRRQPLGRLLLEKVPFFAAAGGFSAVVLMAQSQSGAVLSLEGFPFLWRLKNAIYVYVAYLEKTLFPQNLAFYYPHPHDSLSWAVLGLSLLSLLAVSAITLACYRRYPFLPVGWFWYLGTLVPMIGLVQIGSQQMADRYTYFPLVGIFIAVTWLVPELVPPGLLRTRVLPAAVLASLVLLAATSYSQITYWHDSVTLLRHSKESTPDSAAAHEFLGNALLHVGELQEGAEELEQASRLVPTYFPVHAELGSAYRNLGRYDQSIAQYRAALAIDPQSTATHCDLGLTYFARSQYEDAKRHYLQALEIDPRFVPAFVNLAALAYAQHDYKSAIDYSKRALGVSPDLPSAQICIAMALREEGHFDEAIKRLEQVVAEAPYEPRAEQELTRTRELKANSAKK